jgi:hypothetical protein
MFKEEIHDCHLCKDPVIRVNSFMASVSHGSLSSPPPPLSLSLLLPLLFNPLLPSIVLNIGTDL